MLLRDARDCSYKVDMSRLELPYAPRQPHGKNFVTYAIIS